MNSFDFSVVARQIQGQYKRHSAFAWSLNDYIDIFYTFYNEYRIHMGTNHPRLTSEHVYRVMMQLPFIHDKYHGDIPIEPEEYPKMIDRYFETRFTPGCNYSILHFCSGDIRNMRYHECYG